MRDVTPAFVLAELIALLRQEKIVRPGYNTLQAVISEALVAERRRLSEVVEKALDHDAKAALQQLLVREETLSGLAQVKQDAKNFGYRMMALERKAFRAGSVVPGGERGAAQARHLATECRLLREPGELLFDLRSAPLEARTDQLIFVVLCLATLPATYGQCR